MRRNAKNEIDFNLNFLDIAWRFEEPFFANEWNWPAFMFSYIGKIYQVFLLLLSSSSFSSLLLLLPLLLRNYDTETFVTYTSQMNLIVNSSHMHCSRGAYLGYSKGGIQDVGRVQIADLQDLISSWGAASAEASRQIARAVVYANRYT